jgi:hypothetical protein
MVAEERAIETSADIAPASCPQQVQINVTDSSVHTRGKIMN